MGAWRWGWEDDRKLRAGGTQTPRCVLSELLVTLQGSAPKSPPPGSLPGSPWGHSPTVCSQSPPSPHSSSSCHDFTVTCGTRRVLPSLLRALEGWASASSGLSWPSCPQGLALSRCSINARWMNEGAEACYSRSSRDRTCVISLTGGFSPSFPGA